MHFPRHSFSMLASALLALTLISSAANASPKDKADKHFAEGLRLYSDDNFKEAAVELELSYQALKTQRTLFAWAQTERRLGHCTLAKKLLTEYIANGANAKQSQAAYSLMGDCKQSKELEEKKEEDEEREDVAKGLVGDEDEEFSERADLVRQAPLSENESMSESWYTDWVGVSLLTGGALGLGIGGYYYQQALVLTDEANEINGSDYGPFEAKLRARESKRQSAVIYGAIGGALLGAGAIYFLTRDFEDVEEEEQGLSFSVTGQDMSFSYSGHF